MGVEPNCSLFSSNHARFSCGGVPREFATSLFCLPMYFSSPAAFLAFSVLHNPRKPRPRPRPYPDGVTSFLCSVDNPVVSRAHSHRHLLDRARGVYIVHLGVGGRPGRVERAVKQRTRSVTGDLISTFFAVRC